jgi:hypothetical protein
MSPDLRSETARRTEESATRSPTEKKNQRPAHVGRMRSETNGRQNTTEAGSDRTLWARHRKTERGTPDLTKRTQNIQQVNEITA